jgi:hypothetical protein
MYGRIFGTLEKVGKEFYEDVYGRGGEQNRFDRSFG